MNSRAGIHTQKHPVARSTLISTLLFCLPKLNWVSLLGPGLSFHLDWTLFAYFPQTPFPLFFVVEEIYLPPNINYFFFFLLLDVLLTPSSIKSFPFCSLVFKHLISGLRGDLCTLLRSIQTHYLLQPLPGGIIDRNLFTY